MKAETKQRYCPSCDKTTLHQKQMAAMTLYNVKEKTKQQIVIDVYCCLVCGRMAGA